MYTVCWTEHNGQDRWDRYEHLADVRTLINDINEVSGGVEDILIFNPSSEDFMINPQKLLDS